MSGRAGARTPILPVAFYDRPVLEVAADLLGCVVRYGGVGVRLTEVEAYDGPADPGSHAFRGRTPRTEVMFGPPGHLYVYFSYGMHHCANLVTGPDGQASAVLLRAGEVVEGLDVARERVAVAARARAESRAARTGAAPSQPRPAPDRDLAKGPARLTRVLGLTLEEYGIPVTDPAGSFVVVPRDPGVSLPTIRTGPRVGVAGEGGDAQRFPWRFWLDGDPTVSTYRPAVRRRRRNAT